MSFWEALPSKLIAQVYISAPTSRQITKAWARAIFGPTNYFFKTLGSVQEGTMLGIAKSWTKLLSRPKKASKCRRQWGLSSVLSQGLCGAHNEKVFKLELWRQYEQASTFLLTSPANPLSKSSQAAPGLPFREWLIFTKQLKSSVIKNLQLSLYCKATFINNLAVRVCFSLKH